MPTEQPKTKLVTHEQALGWLLDHCGQTVRATVDADVGSAVLTVAGELRHWREEPDPNRYALAKDGEDIIGLFRVGGTELDLSDLSNVGRFWIHVHEFETGQAEALVVEVLMVEPLMVESDSEAEVGSMWLTINEFFPG